MRSWLTSSVLVLAAGALGAQTQPFKVVVPAVAADAEAAGSVALPFGSSVARHVMYAYDGSLVGHAAPMRIAAITLRCDGNTPGASVAGAYNFTLDVSTSRRAVNALSTTFADNHGHDRLRVHFGALGIVPPPVGAQPNEFSLRITFSNRFDWDPRNGPLLLDFAYSASTPAFGVWDGFSGGVGGLAANGATTAVATSNLGSAPVLRLEVVGEVADATLATAEALVSTSFPWGRPAGSDMRTLGLYDAAAFAGSGRRRITGLAWRCESGGGFPGRTFTVRISLSTSPVTSTTMSQTFAANHGSDLTVVFDGVLDAPPTPFDFDLGGFDLFATLQRPFEYDPAAGSLAVDLQMFDCTGPGTLMDCDSSNANLGRVSDQTSATSTTAPTAASVQPGVGMVMALRTVPVPTAPATLSLGTNPTGGNATGYPFGAAGRRTLLLVSASDAGIVKPFFVRHLAFRPTALSGGPSTFTMTIDLSHAATTPATVSGTFDANHGADRERVFDGQFSVPFFSRAVTDPAFPITIRLQRPFLWDPAVSPHLAIDLRATAVTGPGIQVETTSGFIADDARVFANGANALSGTAQQLAPVVRLGGFGQNGLAVNNGSGCAGLNGVPLATTIGLPSLPNRDLRMRVRGAAGNSAALFIAGFAPLNVPLPGTNNCLVLNTGEVGVLAAAITDPTGDASIALPLIGAPQFDGFQFHGQWWILDPTANALGIVTSDDQLYTARWF